MGLDIFENEEYMDGKCAFIGSVLMILYAILNYVFTREEVICLIIEIMNMW